LFTTTEAEDPEALLLVASFFSASYLPLDLLRLALAGKGLLRQKIKPLPVFVEAALVSWAFPSLQIRVLPGKMGA